jgi:3-hydroxybutyrate dehydrogenase
MSSLEGRVAVVTGGGRGIGAAIARILAGEGAHVVVSGRSQGPLEEVVAAVRGAGGRADWTRCDVSRAEDVTALAATVKRVAGPASIIVNNAGIARSAKVADTDEAAWNEVIAVNLTGAFLVTRAFLPDVLAAGAKGRIIYIGSTASKVGFYYAGAYAASKHGLLGLARTLAMEIAAKGPTVNVVCPGWVETDMADEAVRNIVTRTGRSAVEARRELERMSPQRRFVTPGEVAAVTQFLISDGARGVTGQSWGVDGGQVMT